MISFVLAAMDKLPRSWDEWKVVTWELLAELFIAVLVWALGEKK
jgi:hypothetical protein